MVVRVRMEMQSATKIVITILGILASCLYGGHCNKVSEYCQFESFMAQCKSGHVLVMEHAQYGRMRLGRCVRKDLGYVGCSIDALSELDFLCSGRSLCNVKVPDLGAILEPRLACLEELKNYLEASFLCIKVVSPSNQPCRSGQPFLVSKNSGFLASVTTFASSCGSSKAPWHLKAKHGQRFNITLYDFSRGYYQSSSDNRGQYDQDTCYAYAVVKEESRPEAVTICGGGPRVHHVFTSVTENIEIRILQGSDNRRSYYLLYFEVIGCSDPEYGEEYLVERLLQEARVRCLATDEIWLITCHQNKWNGFVGNCTASDEHDENYGFRLVMGSISMSTEVSIVVVLAVACVIGLCILFTGMCYIRKRSRSTPSHDSPPSYTPPSQYDVTRPFSDVTYKRHTPTTSGRSGAGMTTNDYACILDGQHTVEHENMTTACNCEYICSTGHAHLTIGKQYGPRKQCNCRAIREDIEEGLSDTGLDELVNPLSRYIEDPDLMMNLKDYKIT